MRFPSKDYLGFVLVLISLLLLSSCNFLGGKATPTPFPGDGEEDAFIGIPNPASFYCEEMGYEIRLQDSQEGTIGVCVFPNGAECEEWEFLSGSCSIEWTFCQRQGYNIRAGDGMAVCTFNDGSTCPEYDFFTGECLPPEE